MTTPLDRYFEIIDSADGDIRRLDALRGLFAENVLLLHGGELARGRERVITFHRRKAAGRKAIEHSWAVAVNADGSLTGKWRETGVDLHGGRFSASGDVAAALDADGRIAQLDLTLIGASDRARLLIAKHLQAWTIPDPAERAEAMADVYTADVTLMEPEPDEVVVGRDALNDYVGMVRQKTAPVSVTVESHYPNRQFIHFRWDSVFPGGRSTIGWEVLHTNGDLIERIVIFSPNDESAPENVR
ncbi:hypothetical protein [Streptomyces cadmiisoli]|uniref:hypothetical protein n=1 Tax=Streptomyces cadmiisoli TaxID=2184053 RepID=UPI003D750BA3